MEEQKNIEFKKIIENILFCKNSVFSEEIYNNLTENLFNARIHIMEKINLKKINLYKSALQNILVYLINNCYNVNVKLASKDYNSIGLTNYNSYRELTFINISDDNLRIKAIDFIKNEIKQVSLILRGNDLNGVLVDIKQ